MEEGPAALDCERGDSVVSGLWVLDLGFRGCLLVSA